MQDIILQTYVLIHACTGVATVEPPITDPPRSRQPLYNGVTD